MTSVARPAVRPGLEPSLPRCPWCKRENPPRETIKVDGMVVGLVPEQRWCSNCSHDTTCGTLWCRCETCQREVWDHIGPIVRSR